MTIHRRGNGRSGYTESFNFVTLSCTGVIFYKNNLASMRLNPGPVRNSPAEILECSPCDAPKEHRILAWGGAQRNPR